MDFERFLDPSKEWSNDSPELIELVELGKKYSNPLGKHPGKSTPVQFLGNLLGLLGLSMKSRKDSEGKRWYRLNEEVINDPIRQQVLTCVEAKLSQPKEEIDWEAAINEAHGVSSENQPQTQTEQELEGTAPSPQVLYTNQVEGAVHNLESQGVTEREIGVNTFGADNHPQTQAEQPLEETAPSPQVLYTNQVEGAVNKSESQGVDREVQKMTDSRSDLERLIDAFEAVGSFEDFAEVAGGREVSTVEDAIAFASSQPRRQQLSKWLAELQPSTFDLQPLTDSAEAIADSLAPKCFVVGQQLKGHRYSFAGKVAKVLESFGDWCETTLGTISLTEVGEGRSWSFA
jgi:hypothetical protein